MLVLDAMCHAGKVKCDGLSRASHGVTGFVSFMLVKL